MFVFKFATKYGTFFVLAASLEDAIAEVRYEYPNDLICCVECLNADGEQVLVAYSSWSSISNTVKKREPKPTT